MIRVFGFTSRQSYGSNTYLIKSGDCYAVVDPSCELDYVKSVHADVAENLKYIILTHGHFDHMLEIDSWVNGTRAEVLVGSLDAQMLKDSDKNAYRLFLGKDKGYFGPCTPLLGNETIELGDDLFKVISTPGHTLGGISLLFDECIFVGDTVFADGGYGRYDLFGGDFTTLTKTIRYLMTLDKRLKVYSGHGRPTSIDEICKYFSNI